MIKIICNDLKYHAGKNVLMKIITIFFNTSFQLIFTYRLSFFLKDIPLLRYICFFINYWQKIYFSCEISNKAIIGVGLKFAHPFGIVIGDSVIIGNNVKIWQSVTLGSHGKINEHLKYPVIKNNVNIYAGAIIIGGITIGDGSIIGANSVVNIDVPDNSTAVGIPCKIIKNNEFIS